MPDIQELVAAYASLDRIPMDKADQLIALLEKADTKALKLILKNKVKFCWHIARRQP